MSSSIRRNASRIQQSLSLVDIKTAAKRIIQGDSPLRFLGLDISTNSTGYACLNENGELCEWGNIATGKIASKEVNEIAYKIITELQGLKENITLGMPQLNNIQHPTISMNNIIWQVGIEDFMRQYRSGKFHSKGIFQLAQLNGIISYSCWQLYGVHPIHIHPTAARGLLDIRIKNEPDQDIDTISSKVNIKKYVMDFVQQQEPQAVQIFKRKRNGNFVDHAYDTADAYVIAMYARLKYIEYHLQCNDTLANEFSHHYMELLTHKNTLKSQNLKAKTSKKTIEERVLEKMSTLEKTKYLTTLYCDAIENWIKINNAWLVQRNS